MAERALRKIYTGKYQGEFPEEFWKITVEKLNQAVKGEFKGTYKPLQNQLVYQNGVFAAFKSKAQTQTLENLMTASKAKTFTDFAAEVQGTLKDYNINHLKAEWNTAKKAARSAKRWAQAIADSDLFPNIEYLPSTAKEPRDVHRPYYGMIRPIDDPIWATILPPSDWGCQCGWRTTDKNVTQKPHTQPPPEPGLDNNPGADGAVFSPSHPHFKGTKSADVVKNNIANIEGCDIKDVKLMRWDPETKGAIYHIGELTDNAIDANTKTAIYHMKKGASVKFINVDKTAKGIDLKTPDTLVNGVYNEFKVAEVVNPGFENIKTDLKEAHQKGKRLGKVIDVTLRYQNAEKATIQRAFKAKENVKQMKNVGNTWVINNGKIFGPFTKKQIIEGKFDIK
ncbi:MAG: hypothetical protein JXQ80_12865 [Bacteroidales bacterium]|nr:hypothetical protein [Bacteroidales bacterium]